MHPSSRKRIEELLARPDCRRVRLLSAPSGYGVTSALRAYSLRAGCAYVSLRDNASLARFAGDLVEALAPDVPGLQMTLTAAFERVLDAQSPPAALAEWFCRHAASHTCRIVLDHVHAAGSADVGRFITEIVERSPASFSWTLSSHDLAALPVASWMAHGLADAPIDEAVLALTAAEANSLAKSLAPGLSAGAVERLRQATRGCLADFTILLRTRTAPAAFDVDVDVETVIRDRFESLPRRLQSVALRTVLLPNLGSASLAFVRGAGIARALADLRERRPEFFSGDSNRYHSRVRRFLRARLAAWSEPRRATVIARAAAALEAAGDLPGALDLFVAIRRQSDILRLIEHHAFRPMQSTTAAVLHDALSVVPAETIETNAPALTMRALSASFHGKADVSETLFQHALDRAQTPEQRARIRYYYGLELLRRARLDAIAFLQPDDSFFAAPAEIRVAAMAALGVAHALKGDIATADKWIARSLRRVARLSDGAVRARVYQQAGYVALEAGDYARASRLATRAVTLGDSAGEFEVAASASSVLYVIAADFHDDPARAASYLSSIATYGAKCGSIEKQLMAWIAAYEIEAERGNDAAIEAIERELQEFDVHYGERLPSQGLLPAQVLQTAWSGDFGRAYRTLAASAGLVQAEDREALRCAEIALYAAAAGEAKEAAGALATAVRKLKGVNDGNLRTLRARLYCALAFALLDRVSASAMILTTVRRDLPADRPRLAALCEAVEQIIAFRRGDDNYMELWAALQGLRRSDFGGIARMFEALPARTATVAACGACSA